MEMAWLTDFYHPFVAAFCLLAFLYNVHTWLYPDPIMKLPVPPGVRLFSDHVVSVME